MKDLHWPCQPSPARSPEFGKQRSASFYVQKRELLSRSSRATARSSYRPDPALPPVTGEAVVPAPVLLFSRL